MRRIFFLFFFFLFFTLSYFAFTVVDYSVRKSHHDKLVLFWISKVPSVFVAGQPLISALLFPFHELFDPSFSFLSQDQFWFDWTYLSQFSVLNLVFLFCFALFCFVRCCLIWRPTVGFACLHRQCYAAYTNCVELKSRRKNMLCDCKKNTILSNHPKSLPTC